MNLEALINEIRKRNFQELTIKEASIWLRYNTLKAQEISDEEAFATITNELEQAREIRKNASAGNTSTTAGSGAEFVPESVLVGNLIDISNQKKKYGFLAAFARTHNTLRSQHDVVPILGRTGKAIVKSEKASTGQFKVAKDTLQSLNTGKVQIDAQMLYNNAQISDELSTFSVIELQALMLGRVVEGIVLSQADVILNADNTTGETSNVNTAADIEEEDDFATNPLYNFGKGLRALGLAGSANVTKIDNGAVAGVDDIIDLKALITSTSDPAEMIILMDPKTYYANMKQADFKDAAKNGKDSTIYSGAITNMNGTDVFVTDLIPLSSSNGKVAASGNTKGTIIVVDVRVIQHGSYGEIRTNSEKDFAVSEIFEAAGYWGMNNINGKDSQNFLAIGYNCS